MNNRYAIQLKSNGIVIDYCETLGQAEHWLRNYPVELVDTTKTSKVEVWYTELGGPWGYGHQEEAFATYGGLKRCIINLYKWIKNEISVWGPDIRDIKDYFRHCYLAVNGENKTQWLLQQIDRIDKNILFV